MPKKSCCGNRPWCCTCGAACLGIALLAAVVLLSGGAAYANAVPLRMPAPENASAQKSATADASPQADQAPGDVNVLLESRGHLEYRQEGHSEAFIGVLSAPGNFLRRSEQRKRCFTTYRNAGYKMMFFVGRPSTIGPILRSQGQRATQAEIATSKKLAEESNRFGDLVIVPVRDHYRDTTDKIIWLYQHGLTRNASYIAKVDDDICINVPVFKRLTRYESASDGIYMGFYKFNGKEYDSMKGADGTTASFMSGPIEILSRALAKIIFHDLSNYAALYSIYGTSSEDANLGKWVQHVQDLRLSSVKRLSDFGLRGQHITNAEQEASGR